MNLQTLQHLREMVRTRNGLWMAVSMLLLLANLGLTGLAWVVSGKDRVLLIPSEICHSFWVSADDVAPAYLEQMAVYFTERLLTYNPQSLETQLAAVLPLMDPGYFGVLKNQVSEEVKKVTAQKISSSFFIQQVRVNGLQVHLDGSLMLQMAGVVVSQTPTQAIVTFSNHQGRLYVSAFHTQTGQETGS